jgi:hypothetical protein
VPTSESNLTSYHSVLASLIIKELALSITFAWPTVSSHKTLCFVDRASWYIRIKKTNLTQYLSSLNFINKPLHVSGLFCCPSSRGNTVYIQQLVHVVRFGWLGQQTVYWRVQPITMLYVQGDQKVSVHLMITVQKTRKNILNSFNHLPW